MIHFECDYTEGAHPNIIKRLTETNMMQTCGYGEDEICENARNKIKKAIGNQKADVHFLVGGTQANLTVIDAVLRPYQGVLSAVSGHINVHETGAVEACGHKVLAIDSEDGTIHAEQVREYMERHLHDSSREHTVQPGMVYISHPTELGTLYTLNELEDMSTACAEAGIPLYMDGARLGYGLAAYGTDVTLKDIARLCDVFYIGGTKTGALFGEAVVATRKGLLRHFTPLVKQHGAMLAKGRLLGIQFETLFSGDLYMDICRNAIRMAMKLKEGFTSKGYELYIDSPTNQQFFWLPDEKIDSLMRIATFEMWGPRGENRTPVRLVTDWATRQDEVDELVSHL